MALRKRYPLQFVNRLAPFVTVYVYKPTNVRMREKTTPELWLNESLDIT